MNTYEVLWKKSSEPFVINTMVICARTENDARNMFHSINPFTLISIKEEKEPATAGTATSSRKNIFTALIIAFFRKLVKGACR